MSQQSLILNENDDPRGVLRVLNQIPFAANRIYFIDKMCAVRGGHRHKATRQLMVCARGSVDVYMNNGKREWVENLNSPLKALLIEPQDWHQMKNASSDSLIIVLASHPYDADDYIHEAYQ